MEVEKEVETEVEGGGLDGTTGGESTDGDGSVTGAISVLNSFPLEITETGVMELEVVVWDEVVSIGIEVVAMGVSTTFATFLTKPKNEKKS